MTVAQLECTLYFHSLFAFDCNSTATSSTE